MIAIGDEAPDFHGRTTLDHSVWLRNLRGRTVVLHFFSGALTPGAVVETRRLGDEYDGARALGAEVIGVSSDALAVPGGVAVDLHLPFPMVIDAGGRIADAYGMDGRLSRADRRVSVVVGPQGEVEAIFDHAVEGLQNAAEVLSFLRARRTGSAGDHGARGIRAPGQVIAGRYLLQRRLAEGGMGEVWRAEHLHLKQPVAIKLLREMPTGVDAAMAEGVLERFRFEAQVSAMLARKTAHVVAVHDAGECEAGPFLAMDFVDGRTLHDELDRTGPLDVYLYEHVLAQIVDALTAAHAVGIVHRDLKPSNILLEENAVPDATAGAAPGALPLPFVKVTDFGIAKTADAKLGLDRPKDTAITELVGTPVYMSPEQLRGSGRPDPRMDTWALGVVSYEMLTGFLPFDVPSIVDLMALVVAGPFVPASWIRSDLPPALDAWFARALAKVAGARFGSAGEMLDAYRAALPPKCGRAVHDTKARRVFKAPALPTPDATASVEPGTVSVEEPRAIPASRATSTWRHTVTRAAPWGLVLVVGAAVVSAWLLTSRTDAAEQVVLAPLASAPPSAPASHHRNIPPAVAPSAENHVAATAAPSGHGSARRPPRPAPRTKARPEQHDDADPSAIF